MTVPDLSAMSGIIIAYLMLKGIKMYYLLQLLLAVFGVYGVLNFPGDMRLYVALACLISMFVIGRLDRDKYERKQARRSFLKSEMEKIAQKDQDAVKERDFFMVNSLLWPKGELVLIDAVHSLLKDLGLRVAGGRKYESVDRIAAIPDSNVHFGFEVLLSEGEVEKNHPKIERALKFEKEKKANEKTVIIASTHIRQPLSERERLNQISPDLHDFLCGCQVSLITAYTFYRLWERSKTGEITASHVFQALYSHPGGIFFPAESPLQG